MSRQLLVWGLLCLVLILSTATALLAAEDTVTAQGTNLDELRQANLKAPNTQKVAVLPFYDMTGKQRRSDLAAVTAYMILAREGYQMIPLWEVEKAYLADKGMEPGEQPRKEDAVRIGKILGANLVCYGEVNQLESYVKTSYFSTRKKGKGAMKITLADVKKGDVVFWSRRSETSGGGGVFVKKSSKLERRVSRVILSRSLELFCQGLPSHSHNPLAEITEDDTLPLEKQWVNIREGRTE